jgi:hypothetical protein
MTSWHRAQSEGKPMALAPERFAQWIAQHEHPDEKYGWVYQYHPRSDAHSVALCEMILEDLLAVCDVLRQQALAGSVVYGINYEHAFPLTKKRKSLDLAIGVGTPDTTAKSVAGIYQGSISSLRLSCESKPTMTEHFQSRPRMFDELSSSHRIVHQGEGQKVIAAAISVVNIADTFVSPLRQKSVQLHVARHKQPRAAARMIQHLRGHPIRKFLNAAGFDAYGTIVINCNNRQPAKLHTRLPAPQPGEPDHYETFLNRLSTAYRKVRQTG